jgi:trehalose 6-phosphate phosphatase
MTRCSPPADDQVTSVSAEGGPAVSVPPDLAAALARPADVALFVDFDGTLAPIVDDPDAARPLPGSVDLLDRLAGRLGVVGVVSGRPVSFLQAHLPDSLALAGLYGLESLVGGRRRDHGQGGCWREVIEDLGAHAEAAGPSGMRVERKDLSITLHYREHPGIEDEVAAWAAAEAGRSGLEARPARRSWELHPPIAVDKGTAVADLVGAATMVCFIGDDHGDLPAFEALDHLATAGAASLRVAVDSDELDPDLLAVADLVVEGPAGVQALLAEFLALLPDA